jgi:hypothetical protein
MHAAAYGSRSANVRKIGRVTFSLCHSYIYGTVVSTTPGQLFK